MNATGRRRWALPVLSVTLVLWLLAVVVDFIVFDGPTSPLQWVTIGFVVLMLVVLIAGELRARRGDE